jgi:hypothetical protein
VALFEERYLRVADLRTRLEEVRAQHLAGSYRSHPPFRRYALVVSIGLVALGAIGLVVYVQTSSGPPSQPAQVAQVGPTPLQVGLTAGVTQSSSSSMRLLHLPVKPVPVDFILELPIRTNAPCRAELSEIDKDGRYHRILNSTADLVPLRAGANERVTFRVDSARLHRGDFIIVLRGTGGPAFGSYLFRVTSDTVN